MWYHYNGDVKSLNSNFENIWLQLQCNTFSPIMTTYCCLDSGIAFTFMLKLFVIEIEGSRHTPVTAFFFVMNTPPSAFHGVALGLLTVSFFNESNKDCFMSVPVAQILTSALTSIF